MSPSDIWGHVDATDIDTATATDRTLWNAKLFCCYSSKNLSSTNSISKDTDTDTPEVEVPIPGNGNTTCNGNGSSTNTDYLLWWQDLSGVVELREEITKHSKEGGENGNSGNSGDNGNDNIGRGHSHGAELIHLKALFDEKMIHICSCAKLWKQHAGYGSTNSNSDTNTNSSGAYSLSDLLHCGDASALFSWRNYLSALIREIHHSGDGDGGNNDKSNSKKSTSNARCNGDFISSLPQAMNKSESKSNTSNMTESNPNQSPPPRLPLDLPLYSCASIVAERRFMQNCS